MPQRLRRLLLAVGALTLLAGLQLSGSAPASATVYGPLLCSPGDDRPLVSLRDGQSWSIGTVHATSDFDTNLPSSFRTCSWYGTNHVYRYKCTHEDRDGWRLNIVARDENSELDRQAFSVTCDGASHRVTWSGTQYGSARVHFHLWAPGGSDCDESCPRYLSGWWASVTS